MFQDTIRIGTLVGAGPATADFIRKTLPHGFESYSITFWQKINVDLNQLADDVKKALAGSDAIISSVALFGNPLGTEPVDQESRDGWAKLVDNCHLFGCNIIGGFAGRVVNKPIDDSARPFKEFFGPLAKKAADKGVRFAFENCDMGGDWWNGNWNWAQTPIAWDKMFEAVPLDNIGLEWEPCHQMVKLIDPMPQLRKYRHKIFHVHGKDATIHWDVVREHGVRGPVPFAFHRTPGFGDCNWTDIISDLRAGGFKGSVDIEGWHDPVYRGDLEMTGQVAGLNYLKRCRGTFVPNP